MEEVVGNGVMVGKTDGFVVGIELGKRLLVGSYDGNRVGCDEIVGCALGKELAVGCADSVGFKVGVVLGTWGGLDVVDGISDGTLLLEGEEEGF